MSIREAILAADRKLVPVAVARWGVTVWLKPLSLGDRLGLATDFDAMEPAARVARLVIRSAHDEAGVPLFGDEDAAIVAGLDGEAVASLAKEIRVLNKLDQTEDEADAEKKA